MFLQRSAIAVARRGAVVAAPLARRSFVTTIARRSKAPVSGSNEDKIKTLSEVKDETDLIGPGAAPGTVPTDIEQSTGLERLEILGKIEGVDVFDMRPLDSSRTGTIKDPIVVKSFGKEQYVGCTGCPADSHEVIWITLTKDVFDNLGRCTECGSVYKMEYVGPAEDHHHDHHGYEEPKTFADYVKKEYHYM